MTRSKSNALSPVESSRLVELEETIRGSFRDALLAIAEIRDSRLWRGTHKNFEAYARDRWQLSRTRLYQKLDEAAIVRKTSNMLDVPENERQLEALAIATRGSPLEIVEAKWRQVQEETGKPQPTAKEIRQILRPVSASTPAERTNGTPHQAPVAQESSPTMAEPTNSEQPLSSVRNLNGHEAVVEASESAKVPDSQEEAQPTAADLLEEIADLETLVKERDQQILELEARNTVAPAPAPGLGTHRLDLHDDEYATLGKLIRYVLVKVEIKPDSKVALESILNRYYSEPNA